MNPMSYSQLGLALSLCLFLQTAQAACINELEFFASRRSILSAIRDKKVSAITSAKV